MYSRETGITHSPKYSAEYLRAKYAEKTIPRRSPFKTEILPDVQPAAQPEPESEKQDDNAALPTPAGQKSQEAGITDFLSKLEGDDILLLAVLAFLLFSGNDNNNFDLILAAALLFIEFG